MNRTIILDNANARRLNALRHAAEAAERYALRHAAEAAERYAQSNRSDPFALARARTHISNGIAFYQTQDGSYVWSYDAKSFSFKESLPEGMHFSDGTTTYDKIGWKERTRA